MRRLCFCRSTAFTAALVAACAAAQAGAFSVQPVRLYMTARDRSVAITVENQGAERVTLAADFYSWSQDAQGADQLVPSDVVVLSPPSVTLEPHEKKVVRLARLDLSEQKSESTYRVVLHEVLPPDSDPKQPTLRVALGFSLPMFITPAGVHRSVHCTGVGSPAAGGVECGNDGQAYAQVRKIELVDGDTVLAKSEDAAYILPGARHAFQLTPAKGAPASSPAAKLKVTFDDNASETFDAEPRR